MSPKVIETWLCVCVCVCVSRWWPACPVDHPSPAVSLTARPYPDWHQPCPEAKHNIAVSDPGTNTHTYKDRHTMVGHSNDSLIRSDLGLRCLVFRCLCVNKCPQLLNEKAFTPSPASQSVSCEMQDKCPLWHTYTDTHTHRCLDSALYSCVWILPPSFSPSLCP